MATSQEYNQLHTMLVHYERTMEEAGDQLLQLLTRHFYDVSIEDRREMLVTHQRLVQPSAELDNVAENFKVSTAAWPLRRDAQLDATLANIAAVIG